MRLATSIRCAIASGVFALATLSSSPAGAVYTCGPDHDDCKCGMDDPYPCCDNGGNCTWWAWEQACCKWGAGLPGWGNANQWAGNAKAHPSYDVLKVPVVNSIANRVSGTYGHVAWVTSVSGSKITVTEQGCWGGYGHKSTTYDASYFDGGFIVRNSQCDCTPGQTQSESCGNCGEKKRTCGSACTWGSWGTCGGEGACTPGQTDEQACGDCGHQSRSCKSDCSWGAFDVCDGADPSTSTACDTGKKGVCAKGVEKCVTGSTECVPKVTASDEICDGLDNDCNGLVDDGIKCGQAVETDAGAWPKPATGKTPTASPSGDETDDSGGGCSTNSSAPDRGSLSIAWFALLVLAVRRRAFPNARSDSRARL